MADEVRNLAARTAQETKQIAQIITEFSHQVEKTMSTMEQVVARANDSEKKSQQTAMVIERMVAAVRESSSANLRISEVSQSQMERLAQLQESLDSLATTIRESGSKVGITATISTDLNQVAHELNTIMAGFTFEKHSSLAAISNEKSRHPRANNGLLAQLCSGDGNVKAQGIPSDFSMSGMQLRLPTGTALTNGQQVQLKIHTPYASLDKYRHQEPLQVAAHIVWSNTRGENLACGLEYRHLGTGQKQRLEECLAYSHKTAYNGRSSPSAGENRRPLKHCRLFAARPAAAGK